jgi:hypothetical protein
MKLINSREHVGDAKASIGRSVDPELKMLCAILPGIAAAIRMGTTNQQLRERMRLGIAYLELP